MMIVVVVGGGLFEYKGNDGTLYTCWSLEAQFTTCLD